MTLWDSNAWFPAHQRKGITRFEVIDERGRKYVEWDCQIAEDVQDEGRTLKIFVRRKPEINPDEFHPFDFNR